MSFWYTIFNGTHNDMKLMQNHYCKISLNTPVGGGAKFDIAFSFDICLHILKNYIKNIPRQRQIIHSSHREDCMMHAANLRNRYNRDDINTVD